MKKSKEPQVLNINQTGKKGEEKGVGTVLGQDGLVLRSTEREEAPWAWEGLTRGGGTRLWPLGEEGCKEGMQSQTEAN